MPCSPLFVDLTNSFNNKKSCEESTSYNVDDIFITWNHIHNPQLLKNQLVQQFDMTNFKVHRS